MLRRLTRRRRGDRPHVTLLYHFFHPDDVVSARHFGDMAEELARRGWDVEVLTSNRYCRYPDRGISPRDEDWNGIHIHRVWRPALDQSRNVPRLINLGWMLGGWGVEILRRPPGIYVVGTDPQFSQAILPWLRFASRRSQIVFWGFDLYPEAIVADAPGSRRAAVARALRPLMRQLYRYADVVVDIGPCMRRRLDEYGHRARRETLVPWALVEPAAIRRPDPVIRRELFGDARLGLLYSGNLGKAHAFRVFLDLARRPEVRAAGIGFCFACRGARAAELEASLRPSDTNIRLAGFAQESELEARLASADLHLLSLRPEWSGIVVPSKFFGSLASGRPVLYAGPADSAPAVWIREFDVGVELDPAHLEIAAQRLVALARDPGELRSWQGNAFEAYHTHFSKKVVMDGWDRLLGSLAETSSH